MTVPLWGRVIAAVVGGVLVIIVWSSVIGALIVSRPVGSRLTRAADTCVDGLFRMLVRHLDDGRRDRTLAVEAAAILLGQLAAWLGVAYLGISLLLWPFEPHGAAAAFVTAGSSLFTLGFDVPPGSVPAVLVFLAAATGLVIITLQIAYLPTLYAAFNRRETEIALLNARAGVPSWGPELLARTHYALGSGVSTINTMPELYAQWERWAADVAESHTTYLPLVRFRSPRPKSSWVTALLAVLDSAALFLSLSPERPERARPAVPAQRVRLLPPDRPGHGFRHSRRGGSGGRHHPDVRGVPRRGAAHEGGRLPAGTGPGRCLAGLRGLAGQLREGRLPGGLRRRPRTGQVVRTAP